MKRTRRLLALVLGVLLLIPGTPLILPTGAAAATAASDTPVPPAGYHLTGRTFDDETYGTLYYVSTESSPEGWVDGYWMTADGKRADNAPCRRILTRRRQTPSPPTCPQHTTREAMG